VEQGTVETESQRARAKKHPKRRRTLKKIQKLRKMMKTYRMRARLVAGQVVAAKKDIKMKPVNLNKLVGPYLGSGLYLAVTRDNTTVVGTGKTIEDAVKYAANAGYADPVIMRAPSRKRIENSLRF
jgi:hypothetical protein